MSTQEQPVRARHPLDPLTADEFRQAAAALRRDRAVGTGWRIASVELREPPKDALLAGDAPLADTGPGREALAVCWNREDGRAYRAVVSLDAGAVTAWEPLPGQQPNITLDEWHECDEMLRSDPALAAALARRGITDRSRILTDLWAYGADLVPPRYRGLRLGWADVWYRGSEQGSPYAHHLSGLHPVVDLNRMTLLEIDDSAAPGATAAPPEVMGEYLPKLIPMPLREVAPLEISQPDGVSFQLDGHLLRWQNWELRLGFNYREGLVLHTVGFRDGGRLRPVAHRLSFAEMVVPYRDPTPDHFRRTAFDIGEWGLGFMTTSLERGCDCLGEITYVDAVVHDSAGEPRLIPHAICIHEEDNGVLWKHVDHEFGPEVRRARRLVVSFHVTVANYEYLVYWRFYQDASIECEVRATGIMVTSNFPAGQQPPYGTLVNERTYAPFHQHFIVARLDLDVDGQANTVYAVESKPGPPGTGRPVWARPGAPPDAASHRGGGQAGLRLAHPARLEGREHGRAELPRHPGRVQAGAGRVVPGPARPLVRGAAPRRGDRAHALGHPVPPGRAVAVRRLPHPERGRFRAARLDRAEPLPREHRRRLVVRVRHPPHHPARGLADHAGGHGVVLAQAVRVLRP